MFQRSLTRCAGPIALTCLLAVPVLANQPGGRVTGSFGAQPLELAVSPELSEASLTGGYTDLFVTAAQMSGDQGPVTLTLTLSGAAQAPEEVTLTLTFARDMGKSWQGDQGSLTLKIGELASRNGLVSLKGTVTGQVSDGGEVRPVTFSVDSLLEDPG